MTGSQSWNQQTDIEVLGLPGIAFIDISVSARCCHLLQKESDRTVYGNVITATALEARTMAFSDLINETMSQSCNAYKLASIFGAQHPPVKHTSSQSNMLAFPKYPHCGAQSDCIAIRPEFRFPPSFLNTENTRMFTASTSKCIRSKKTQTLLLH
jgi:hypothetical protein